ncbi:MAG TPA: hypothetical protein ENK93_05505 [Campylobacteraceae bacterium]|nr:hypothetical protein [Campylobacteraceae bacterium]
MRDMKLFVIVALLFLLLVSLGGIYYVYMQNLSLQRQQHQNVQVIVAAHDIPQNHKITREDLKSVAFQRALVPFKILMPNEIVGKYATVKIFKDEPIRTEKINKSIKHAETNSTARKAKYDLYNLYLKKYFQNPNYMLKSGDRIDIIGVWKDKKGLTVKYISTDVDVYGFLFKGVLEENALKRVEKSVKDKKHKKTKTITLFEYADEILLDTRADSVTGIIRAYNKGEQLWMVLSGDADKTKSIENIKKQYEAGLQPVVSKMTSHVKRRKRTRYPKATISYGAGESTTVSVWRRQR